MTLRLSIPSDHPCLPGHFPGNPVVPGVVILDHVQTLLQQQYPGRRLLGVGNVKFLAPLLPEQTCTVEFGSVDADPTQELTVQFTVLHNAQMLAKGKLRLAATGVKA